MFSCFHVIALMHIYRNTQIHKSTKVYVFMDLCVYGFIYFCIPLLISLFPFINK